MPRRKEPMIPDALLDQLLAGADPKAAFDPGGLLDGLKKAFAERALNAEMDHHLAGEGGAGNSRNGYQRVEETRLQPPGSGSKLTTSIAASVAVATVRMTSAAPSAVARASRCAAARARNSRGVPAPTRRRITSPRL